MLYKMFIQILVNLIMLLVVLLDLTQAPNNRIKDFLQVHNTNKKLII